jgi:ribosomal protein L31E
MKKMDFSSALEELELLLQTAERRLSAAVKTEKRRLEREMDVQLVRLEKNVARLSYGNGAEKKAI